MQVNSRKSFTLIEIITVLAIIMILASMVLVVSKGALTRAKKSKAEAMIASLSVAVSMFYNDCGNYPDTQVFSAYPEPVYANIIQANETLRYCLYESAVAAFYSGWKGPYIEVKSSDLLNIGAGAYEEIIDPWKKPYAFCSKRNTPIAVLHNKGTFDIYSAGPDGIYGNADDINNW